MPPRKLIKVLPTIIRKNEPLVLGLDPSTHTGLCLLQGGSGNPSVLTHKVVTKLGLTGVTRAHAIAVEVMQALEGRTPDLVVMEGYGFKNKFTLSILLEIGTVLRLMFLQRQVPVAILTPKGLKQWVTGDGQADKAAMIAAVATRWGLVTKDDNEADACGLGTAGLAFLGAINCTSAERKIISQIAFLPCLGSR